jgi:hypothetical protein
MSVLIAVALSVGLIDGLAKSTSQTASTAPTYPKTFIQDVTDGSDKYRQSKQPQHPRLPSTPKASSKPSLFTRLRHIEEKPVEAFMRRLRNSSAYEPLKWWNNLGSPWEQAYGFGKSVANLAQGLNTLQQLTSPLHWVIDPQGQLRQTTELAKAVQFSVEHPGEFLKELGDWEDLKHGRIARWEGYLAEQILEERLTGGSGVFTRVMVKAGGATKAAQDARADGTIAVPPVVHSTHLPTPQVGVSVAKSHSGRSTHLPTPQVGASVAKSHSGRSTHLPTPRVGASVGASVARR